MIKIFRFVCLVFVTCHIATADPVGPEQIHISFGPSSNKMYVMWSRVFKDFPKETVGTLFVLSKLAYCGFIHWYSNGDNDPFFAAGRNWKEPKIVFTVEDIQQCGIGVTAGWVGYGLLNTTHAHQVPTHVVTYNFAHLTIQEFMCALYMSTMSDEEQWHILNEHFNDYPNVFVFLCGITGLASCVVSKFVYEKVASCLASSVAVAVKCLFEDKQFIPHQITSPFELYLNHKTLLPYDCLCISHVFSCYPVLKLSMGFCSIQDKGVELLGKDCHSISAGGNVLQELYLNGNDLTKIGIEHVMKIVTKS